jgi:hypothetical protein
MALVLLPLAHMVVRDADAPESKGVNMNAHPLIDDQAIFPFAFEIENAYVSTSTIANLLSETPGVSDVRKRTLFSKWEHVHIWFRYKNVEFVVTEPYGDSSEYWIGPNDEKDRLDVSELLAQFKGYQPSFMRKIFGDVLMLRWIPKAR